MKSGNTIAAQPSDVHEYE